MAKKQQVAKQTPSISKEQLEELRAILPQVFTEGKIDFDKLRASVGDFADPSTGSGQVPPERYSFSWAGKRDAVRILQTPSRATLIPERKESVDFDKTQNIFIEGDNLEVLKLLYKPYFGQVKMIYIDPPYNTGNDFVYPDNFAEPLDTYLQLTGQKDSEGNLLTSNAETSGRYHSAWLSMMYPRLFLARNLLREDGAIFVSIDDNEVHNLRMIMNEVFGEENFIANIIWQKKFAPQNDARYLSDNHDHILLYTRTKELWKRNLLPRTEKADQRYQNPDNDPRGSWASSDLLRMEYRENSLYKIISPTGKEWIPEPGTSWRHPEEEMLALIADNQVWFGLDGNSKPRRKRFLKDVRAGLVPETIWSHEDVGHNQEATQDFKSLMTGTRAEFDAPKPSRLVKRMLQISTSNNSNDIILDFFSGSCTTAQAVLELNREDGGNRRFIMVQLPEPTKISILGVRDAPLLMLGTISGVGKERIRRVIKKMKKEREGQLKLDKPEDLGFKVFKLAESNYKQWQGEGEKDPKAYAAQMQMFSDPLVKGWKEEDVTYEVALKEGYGLNVVLEKTEVKGVQKVSDPDKEQSFYISLADKIKLKDLKPLNLKKDDLFICRDIALDDETAANLSLQCRLKTI